MSRPTKISAPTISEIEALVQQRLAGEIEEKEVSSPMKQYIGQRICDARESAGLNRTQMAKLVGIDPPHQLYMIEKGKTGVSIERLFLIAAALGLKPSDFLDPEVAFIPATKAS